MCGRAVARVDAAEATGSIQRWSQEDHLGTLLVAARAGHIVDRKRLSSINRATLSNGMRICLQGVQGLETSPAAYAPNSFVTHFVAPFVPGTMKLSCARVEQSVRIVIHDRS
jgi:hypothetical protein